MEIYSAGDDRRQLKQKSMGKRRGISYRKRVEDINRIYDRYARSGLSNREIFNRYIYPVYGISERTFYNMMNAAAGVKPPAVAFGAPGLFDFLEEKPGENQEKEKEDGGY